jgi:LPXTG-motif cell wall-anchored protein
MLRLLGLLLVIWLAITVIGAVVEGLFWLAVIGLLFVAATAVLGWNKRRDDKALPRGW